MNATFEHFEMNTNNAYATLNTAEIATTRLNRAYMTTEETVYATLDGQVLPGMDGYDYVNWCQWLTVPVSKLKLCRDFDLHACIVDV